MGGCIAKAQRWAAYILLKKAVNVQAAQSEGRILSDVGWGEECGSDGTAKVKLWMLRVPGELWDLKLGVRKADGE